MPTQTNRTTTQPAVTSFPKNKWLPLLIRLTLGVGLLVAVFSSVDLQDVTTHLTSARPVPLVVLCIVALLGRVLMAYKWNLLLRARGVAISVRQATRLYFVGNLLGVFTPGGVGADAYRVTALARFHKTPIVIATVFLERFIGLAVIGVFVAVSVSVSPQVFGIDSTWVVWAIIAGATLLVICVWASLHPWLKIGGLARRLLYFSRIKVFRKLSDFYHTYTESRLHLPILLAFTVLTAVEVVLSVSVIHLAAASLGIGVSFVYLLTVVPFIYVVIRLPVSFHGIGVQEGLYAYFLVDAGFSTADGLSISLLLRVAEVFLTFLPAATMLWLGPMQIEPLTHSSEQVED